MTIDLASFRKTLTYQRTAPVKRLSIDMSAIAEIDKTAEAKKGQFQIILMIAILGCVISLFSFGIYIGFVLLPVCLVAAIYAGIMGSRYSRIDVANYRYGLLGKILSVLGRDVENNASLDVTLVLSPPTEKKKRLETVPHSYKRGWKIDRFRDDWLSLQGKFMDETQFSFTVAEAVVIQRGRKRSASGKIKSKRKVKSKGFEIALMLTFSRRKYGAIAVLKNEAQGAIQLPEAVQLKTLRVKDNSMYIRVRTPPWGSMQQSLFAADTSSLAEESIDPLYQTMTMMLLSLYQVLNLANALSKKTT